MEHLEIVPPAVRGSVQNMSSQDEDGLWQITCLNTQTRIYAYKEDKYWNPELKAAFLKRVTRLWDDSFWDKSRNVPEEAHIDQQVLRIE